MGWHALGRYITPSGERVVLILAGGVYDALDAASATGGMRELPALSRGIPGLMEDWPAAATALSEVASRAETLAASGRIQAVAGTRLLAPYLPQRIFAAASNYQEHAKEMGTKLAARTELQPYF